MRKRQALPYGSWPSPVGAELVAEGSVPADEVWADGDAVWWREPRPAEGGRYVVVRADLDGSRRDVTPPGFNVRSRVHEYGGGSYLVAGDLVIFSNFEDQRLYRQDRDGPRDRSRRRRRRRRRFASRTAVSPPTGGCSCACARPMPTGRW